MSLLTLTRLRTYPLSQLEASQRVLGVARKSFKGRFCFVSLTLTSAWYSNTGFAVRVVQKLSDQYRNVATKKPVFERIEVGRLDSV